ncbi:SMP-30/gluconolactonase/LRE family protein [Nocardia alni]|uniref:SMP-30/gluconolactonase/LRE family protein n=1 Tax=Nocardia alni TaxID=2815723 RepID=UPI001C228857|nr:hypothetical protein [Nocardia alni]
MEIRSIAGAVTAVVAAATTLTMPAMSAGAQPSCPHATVSTLSAATTPGLDWSENVGTDRHGALWVSRLSRNVVERVDENGHVTASVAVDSPGAVRAARDNLVYADFGDSTTNLPPGSHGGGVVRFDPDRPTSGPHVVVSGLGMANGLSFDSAGNLYVADTSTGVVRIRPDGSVDTQWSAQARIPGLDGLAITGDSVYATQIFSPTGRILRIPIATPARPRVVADLGSGGVPPLPDDMTVGPDGVLYLATGTGRLVQVDPATGQVCTLLSGEPMTSVAIDPHHPGTLILGTESGDLLRARVEQ